MTRIPSTHQQTLVILTTTIATLLSGVAFTKAHAATIDTTGTTITLNIDDPQNQYIGNGTLQVADDGSGLIELSTTGAAAATEFAMTGGLIDLSSNVTLRNGGFAAGVWTNNLASLNVNTGATLDVWDGNPVRVDALSGAGTITISPAFGTNWAGDRSLVVGVNGGSATFTGAIAGNSGNDGGKLSVIKEGIGTQTLTGTLSYDGATTVNGGRLIIQNGVTGGDTDLRSTNLTANNNGTLEISVTNASLSNDRKFLAGGTISGTGTFVKSGPGALLIKDGQTVAMTGATSVIDVQGGLFRNENGNTVWTNNKAGVNVASGAVFDIWDVDTVIDELNGSGSINKGWNASKTLVVGINNGSGTFTGNIFNNSQTLGYTGASGGTLAIRKEGSGTQVIDATGKTVNYTGVTTVNGGHLTLINAAPAANYVTNAELEFKAATGTLTTTNRTISGTGKVIKSGPNLMTLSFSTGTQAQWRGGIVVNEGRLKFNQTGNDNNNFVGNTTNAGGQFDIQIADGATFEVGWQASSGANVSGKNLFMRGGTISGDGSFVKTGGGNLLFDANNNGGLKFALTGANSLIDVQAGYVRNENGNGNGGQYANNKAGLNVASNAVFDIWDGATRMDEVTGAGSLNKGWNSDTTLTIGVNNGTGVFNGSIFNNNTTNTGNNMITAPVNGFPLGSVGGKMAIVKEGAGTQTFAPNAGKTVDYNGGTTINAGRLVFKDLNHAGDSNVVINSEFELSANTLNSATTTLSNGTISGAGNLFKTGVGIANLGGNARPETIALSGANSMIFIQGGVLKNDWSNGTSSASIWGNNKAGMEISAGAVFDLWDGSGPTIDELNGAGTINKASGGSSQTVTIGVNNGNGSFSGTISENQNLGYGGGGTGSIGLIKKGTGTQVFSGTGAYSGGTTIDGGAFLVNGPGTIGAVTVNDDATLGGSDGFVGATTVNAGGTLSPGTSIGTLNLAGLSLTDTAIFHLEIGSTSSDLAKVSGAALLDGLIALDITLVAQPTENQTYLFLQADGGLDGLDDGARFSYLGNTLEEGEFFTVTGTYTQDFTITYTANGGNGVAVSAVPEPSSAVALLGGLGVLLGLTRHRRRD